MCVDNSQYPVSLEIGKVYRAFPPHRADLHGWLSVIDESGEAYLYPAKRFVAVELPARGRRAVIASAQ